MKAEPNAQLEWLWANCKIVYWPKDESYPLEHSGLKNLRDHIEFEMMKELNGPDKLTIMACESANQWIPFTRNQEQSFQCDLRKAYVAGFIARAKGEKP